MSGVLLAIAYTMLFLLFMSRSRFYVGIPCLPFKWLSAIFVLKIMAGTSLWAIYTWVYPDRTTADVFKYFDDSAVMFSALPERPLDYLSMLFGYKNDTPWLTEQYYMVMNNWFRQFESNLYNDAHTIIRFNAFVRLFSFGEFHVHTVFAAFISLTGMVGIYRAFVNYLGGRERALIAAVFLIPSVMFWASGVIKESLLFFGLGLMIYQLSEFIIGRISFGGILAILFSGMLLFFLKFYVLLSFFPAIVLAAWAFHQPKPHVAIKVVVVYGCCLAMALSAPYIISGFDILEIITNKQKDFIGLVQDVGAGSFVMPPLLEPTLASFIKLSPYALYMTLFGPLTHASMGAMGLVSAFENFILIVLFAICIWHRSPKPQAPRGLILSLTLYVILLALVIGWTTPVMGALVRYRTPLLPFLMIVGLLILDQKKLFNRWPKLEPYISA